MYIPVEQKSLKDCVRLITRHVGRHIHCTCSNQILSWKIRELNPFSKIWIRSFSVDQMWHFEKRILNAGHQVGRRALNRINELNRINAAEFIRHLARF